MDRCIAIIPAAGQGKRMNAGINKQFLSLQGMPVIVHTLQVFEKCELVDRIILVVAKEEEAQYREEIIPRYGFKKVSHVIVGGKERQDSVYNGFSMIEDGTKLVLIHDGARPLITEELIAKSIVSASAFGAAVVAVPVKDTIKEVDENGVVRRTLNRKVLWQAQTPQAFQYEVLGEALDYCREIGFTGTDDTSLVERIDGKVKIVPGSYENLKITTPEDLILAEAILQRRNS